MNLHEIILGDLTLRAFSSGALTFLKAPKGDSRRGYIIGLEDGSTFGVRMNSGNTRYAVVPSIRGANPITGLAEDGDLRVMGRGTLCPKNHGVLKKEGYCPVCQHYWPTSNSIAVDNYAVLEGWRVARGVTRAFTFVTDLKKDVASALVLADPGCSLNLYVYKSFTARPWYSDLWRHPYNPLDPMTSWQCSHPVALLNSSCPETSVGVGGDTPKESSESAHGPLDSYEDTPTLVEIHLVPLAEARTMVERESQATGPFTGIPGL